MCCSWFGLCLSSPAAASGSEAMLAPPLAYKKWALQDQDVVTDHVACGVSTPNPFDQLCSASMYGGYNATIRPTPPASHLYVTSGSWPYVGFYYAVEVRCLCVVLCVACY